MCDPLSIFWHVKIESSNWIPPVSMASWKEFSWVFTVDNDAPPKFVSWELSEFELSEFDWVDSDVVDSDIFSNEFVVDDSVG